jgi:hypothetical protein
MTFVVLRIRVMVPNERPRREQGGTGRDGGAHTDAGAEGAGEQCGHGPGQGPSARSDTRAAVSDAAENLIGAIRGLRKPSSRTATN